MARIPKDGRDPVNTSGPAAPNGVDPEKWAKVMATVARVNADTKVGGAKKPKIYTGERFPDIERIRTGVLSVDVITGGGIPRGRATQFEGKESSFKTGTVFSTVRQVQKSGGVTLWVQGEEFDPAWARLWGVNPEAIVMVPITTTNVMLETASQIIEAGGVDLAVVDSVQALNSYAPANLEAVGEGGYGNGAPQMWRQFNARVNKAISEGTAARTAVLWISQMQAVVGQYNAPVDGVGTAIKCLRHWKSVDVMFKPGELKRGGKDEEPYARLINVRCEKNKTFRPYMEGEFLYYYQDREGVQRGYDLASDVVVWALQFGFVQQSGSWIADSGDPSIRHQGFDKFAAFLRSDPAFLQEYYDAIMGHVTSLVKGET